MRHWLSPLLVLALLFGGAMANARYVSKSVDGWCAGVEAALAAAEAEDWEGAREALGAVYASWDARQTYFHIMVEHAELDAAEALKGTRQYIQAARSMGAVMQLSRYFDQYKAIEPVRFSLPSDADRRASAARADTA